jgi:hypothetical protein
MKKIGMPFTDGTGSREGTAPAKFVFPIFFPDAGEKEAVGKRESDCFSIIGKKNITTGKSFN